MIHTYMTSSVCLFLLSPTRTHTHTDGKIGEKKSSKSGMTYSALFTFHITITRVSPPKNIIYIHVYAHVHAWERNCVSRILRWRGNFKQPRTTLTRPTWGRQRYNSRCEKAFIFDFKRRDKNLCERRFRRKRGRNILCCSRRFRRKRGRNVLCCSRRSGLSFLSWFLCTGRYT